jgi:small-conductance mechanosensitive channel
MTHFLKDWQNWLAEFGIILGSIAAGWVAHYVIFSILGRLARKPERVIDASFVKHGRRPARWVLPLLILLVTVPLGPFSASSRNAVEHLIGVGLIAAVAWGLILMTEVFSDLLSARYRVDVEDNLAARRIQTQVSVLRRILTVVVVIVATAIVLLSIPQVRSIGTSLLASAGLAGLVIGMAMKSTLGNLIAGIQIALTQPIRMEDAVIVQGEWGWIEEITSTYVVVRLWDWRRMVLPLTYFIEQPFQNWTRTTARLIGSVHLYADYTLPVDEVRKELDRIVKTHHKWAGTVCVLQVTHATANTIELRALADARDAGTAWDLRCYIRENLIKFIQEKYPQCLPRTRAEFNPVAEQGRVA